VIHFEQTLTRPLISFPWAEGQGLMSTDPPALRHRLRRVVSICLVEEADQSLGSVGHGDIFYNASPRRFRRLRRLLIRH
jgi:hypothetical protein